MLGSLIEAASRDSRSNRSRNVWSPASSGAISFGYLVPEPEILGSVDDAHAAPPDHLLEAVVGEQLAYPRKLSDAPDVTSKDRLLVHLVPLLCRVTGRWQEAAPGYQRGANAAPT